MKIRDFGALFLDCGQRQSSEMREDCEEDLLRFRDLDRVKNMVRRGAGRSKQEQIDCQAVEVRELVDAILNPPMDE